MSSILKDFASFLEDRGLVIANEDAISQVPSEDYSFSQSIFKNREVLVPLLCTLAIGIREGKNPITYRISYKGGMAIVRQFLQDLVNKFLCNLKKRNLISEWHLKSDCQYEISVSADEDKRRFFRSAWAEQVFRYVIMKTVQTFCTSRKISVKSFQNVKLKQKDDDNDFTELDLVVQIKNRFYIFEVKSGPCINIMQWAKRENSLVMGNEVVRNIVCTVHDSIPDKIFEPQLLLKLNNIEKELGKILESDFPNEYSNSINTDSSSVPCALCDSASLRDTHNSLKRSGYEEKKRT